MSRKLIITALVLLGIVLVVEVTRAPEPTRTSTATELYKATSTLPSTSTGTTSTTTGAAQTYILGAAKSVVLKMGQPILLGRSTVSLTNVEDSRCGEGNTCIWAGEVKAKLTIASDGRKKDATLLFPGSSQTILGRTYRVVSVKPSYPTTQTGNYEVYISSSPLIQKTNN